MERVIDGVRYRIQKEVFHIYDHEAIEKHLEEMAAKGWIFEGFNSLNYWEYRQEKPQKIKYAVTYIPGANTDGTLNEAQQTMDELCSQAGWQRVASYDAAQIYCSTLDNPVPVETDEWSRMEVMKKSMRRGMGSNIFLVIIWGANLLLRMGNLLRGPVEVLANYQAILNIVILVFLVLRWGLDIVFYTRWIRKSEESVREGGSCCDFKEIDSIYDWISPVLLILVVAAICAFNYHWGMYLFFILMLGLCMYGGEWAKIREIIGRTGKISKKRAAKLVVLYGVVIACFITAVAVGMMRPEPVEESGASRQNETIFAAEEIGRFKNVPAFYEDYEVKTEFLFDWMLYGFLEAKNYRGQYIQMSDDEAAEWHADTGYTFSNRSDCVVIVCRNRFVCIEGYDEELTAEQKLAAAEELDFI